MLQCIKRAVSADDGGRPEEKEALLHGCVVRFVHYVEQNRSTLPSPVVEVIEQEAKTILGSWPNAGKKNEEFIKSSKTSLLASYIGKLKYI
jgi:hypothetical protein